MYIRKKGNLFLLLHKWERGKMYIVLVLGGLFCICLEWGGEMAFTGRRNLSKGPRKWGWGRDPGMCYRPEWCEVKRQPFVTQHDSCIERPLTPWPARQFWRKQKGMGSNGHLEKNHHQPFLFSFSLVSWGWGSDHHLSFAEPKPEHPWTRAISL